MLSRNRLLIQVVLAVATAAPVMAVAEDGDWLLRFGVHQINPDKNNLPDVLGGNVVLDKDETFTLDAEYMLTRASVDLFAPHLATCAQEHELGTPRRSASRPLAPIAGPTGTSTPTVDPPLSGVGVNSGFR
jgi:outer membrane protein W